jgi:hypothetical protein
MTQFFRKFAFTFNLRHALIVWLLAFTALAATTSLVWAQPMARVGLIAEVAGTAWLFDPGARAWVPVQRNQTIAQGDQLRTAPLSRVTVRVGSSTLWLDAQTELQVLQMDDAAFTLRLLAGDVALRLRDPRVARATRVQTREGVVSHPMEGLVRVAQGNRVTRVGVLQGRAQFDSDPGAPLQRAWLREGEQAEFEWADSARMERQALGQDNFSVWFINRDQFESGLTQRGEVYYAPPETMRSETVYPYDNRGSAVVEYGRVWIPTPPARGWEPHRREVEPNRHPRPHFQPQPEPGHYQPRPNRDPQAPGFNRDRGWNPPAQHHRPVVPSTNPAPVVPATPTAPAVPAAPVPRVVPPPAQTVTTAPAAPRQTNPAEEEKRDNPRHNRRDNLERELRKPIVEFQR